MRIGKDSGLYDKSRDEIIFFEKVFYMKILKNESTLQKSLKMRALCKHFSKFKILLKKLLLFLCQKNKKKLSLIAKDVRTQMNKCRHYHHLNA